MIIVLFLGKLIFLYRSTNVDVEILNSSLSNCDWETILKNHFDVDAVFEDWFSLFHTTIVKYVGKACGPDRIGNRITK